MNSIPLNIKEEAKRLIDRLPDTITWDDLIYEIYVRESIEQGLKQSESGELVEVEKIREKYGLPK